LFYPKNRLQKINMKKGNADFILCYYFQKILIKSTVNKKPILSEFTD